MKSDNETGRTLSANGLWMLMFEIDHDKGNIQFSNQLIFSNPLEQDQE